LSQVEIEAKKSVSSGDGGIGRRRWRFYAGPIVGAAAAEVAWILLEATARYTLLAGKGGNGDAPVSSLGFRYVGTLLIALHLAAFFGGMAGVIMARSRNRLIALLMGALAPTLLAAAWTVSYHLWQAPEMGASIYLWLPGLALGGALGGWAGSFTAAGE
jgi:hypothetical protein